MLLQITLFTLLLAYCSGVSDHTIVGEQWEEFKLKHKKIYASKDEEQYRMEVFMDNMHTITQHNKLYERGLSTYTMAMNKFGDLTHEEFSRYYLMPPQRYDDLIRENMVTGDPMRVHAHQELPTDQDWRAAGAVTEIKDQKKCAACYAFAAIGALESHHFLRKGELITLSEQNILDCTYMQPPYSNNGCKGGRVDNTYSYIIDHGIDSEESYPYQAMDGEYCEFSSANVAANMTKYIDLPKGNETQLQYAIAFIGPVAVMADAKNMEFYSGGIYDDPRCDSELYTHGMVVVGYGVFENSIDYWIVKNSWGDLWGEDGYIMMVRNKNNQCGIATASLYPVV